VLNDLELCCFRPEDFRVLKKHYLIRWRAEAKKSVTGIWPQSVPCCGVDTAVQISNNNTEPASG